MGVDPESDLAAEAQSGGGSAIGPLVIHAGLPIQLIPLAVSSELRFKRTGAGLAPTEGNVRRLTRDEGMALRFVVQRDLDGTWSVRVSGSNDPVVLHGTPQLRLTEDLAAIRAKKLNDHILEADNTLAEATMPQPV